MVFLGGSHQAAGRRHILLHVATYAAFLLAGAVTLSGCGGGGGGGETNPNPTPTPNTNATIRGRVIESTTTELVSGAVVRIGDAIATTGPNGEFTIQVPSSTEDRILRVDLPRDQSTNRSLFQNVGYARNQRCIPVNSDTEGFTVSRNDLEGGDNTNFGDIIVYFFSGPPAPPCGLF
ncbi:MAG: hypothetical protein H8F28_26340 [Fibrella sp.]|nr:hypothetical protein [Armatimonadota bacterium]